MPKYLDENGLAAQIAMEKATFINKNEVQEEEVDNSPTSNSSRLVTSGGVAGALAGKQDTIDASHKLDYSLLSNTPTIPAAQVNSDWNANSGVAQILNKPTIPTVPTISTNIEQDKASDAKTASPKAVYDEVHPAVVSTQPQGGFLPNVEYNLGTLTGSVTFALASAVSGITNHYFWTFMTGSTAPSITWPSGIAWNGGSAPTINAQKYYEISILNNRAVWIETDLLGGIQDDPDI